MSERNQILSAYKELKGVLDSLGKETSWFSDREFTPQANRVIERVGSVCPEIEDIVSYKLQPDFLQDGRPIVRVTATRQKLMSLLGRIEGLYGIGEGEVQNGHTQGYTFIQQQSQSQTQYVTVVLELQEKILKELPNHVQGSKERNFLEKFKEALPSLNSLTDILSTVLTLAANFKLDPSAIIKLLGL